jgi:hypothetical protein
MGSLKEEFNAVDLGGDFSSRFIKKFGPGAKDLIINQLANQKYKSDIDAYFIETDRQMSSGQIYEQASKFQDSLFESKLSSSKWNPLSISKMDKSNINQGSSFLGEDLELHPSF